MKKILITGGAGFIGSNFIHYILDHRKKIQVTNFDSLTYSGNLDNLKDIQDSENYRFIKGDICSEESINCLFREYDFSAVVHFAAESMWIVPSETPCSSSRPMCWDYQSAKPKPCLLEPTGQQRKKGIPFSAYLHG